MSLLFGNSGSPFGNGQPVRRSRTWNDNGIQHTQKEYSNSGPGWAFSVQSHSSGGDLFASPSQAGGSGRRSGFGSLINNAVNSVFSNLQHSGTSGGQKHVRRRSTQNAAYGDDSSSIQRSPVASRPRHSGSRSGYDDIESRRRHGQPHNDSRRSSRRSRPSTRSAGSTIRSAFVEDYSSSDETSAFDSSGLQHQDLMSSETENILALENAAEAHRKEARHARRRLDQARRQPMSNPSYLQKLAQQVENHEEARGILLSDLEGARKAAKKKQYEQRKPRQHHRSLRHETIQDDFDDNPFFNDPIFDPFAPFQAQRQSRQAEFAHGSGASFGGFPFANFDSFFADFERMASMHHNMHQQFFSMPGASFTASPRARPGNTRFASGNGPQFQHTPGFTAFTSQPSAPPTTMLKPEEAQGLFASYNERWNKASPVDPNIPFPTRGLKASNLSTCNTLWAPSVGSPIETWSEETVMKANAQAFFLGAVGLRPAYSESAGAKIELGIDKASGTPAQKQKLIEILKKERTRWHSDRLGMRNGGGTGPNEALQGDKRARAVYHGICELMEAAQ